MSLIEQSIKVRGLAIDRPLLRDYDRIARDMRPDEIAQWLALTGETAYDPEATARAFLGVGGIAHALIGPDGHAVLVGGHERIRPGVWRGWLMGTMAGWAAHGFGISRVCRRLQDNLLRSPHAHRVEVIALASRKPAHVWYERALGLRYEGLLRGYCADGSDAVIYARTKGDL